MRRGAVDGIVITGKSDNLCGIEITDGKVSFADAESFAQADTDTVYESLKSKGAVACVGPAAENGVRFASIMVDGSFAAGRNGLGLVMAEKGLKYLVVKGTGKVTVHDRDALRTAREDLYRLIAASPVLMGEHGLTNYGTGALYDLMDSRRMMPTANFRRTHFDSAAAMNAAAYKKAYDTGKGGCRGCHIQCKMIGKRGEHVPEFETMSHFSALWENTDLRAVMRANDFCNRKGLDTISLGSVLACHSELTGDALTSERLNQLLDAIASGSGIGVELGKGSWEYANAHGKPERSISVKKLDLPAYDPRGAYGMALAYSTSTRGACHLRAYPISHEILRKPVATDRFSFEGKARIIKISEDLNATIDSLTACKFVFFAGSLEEYAKVYTAVTGTDMTAQDLLKTGERIYYHDRVMNAMNGFDVTDDDLPPRFFNESGSSGNGIEVKPLNRHEFENTRGNYYKIRGLTPDGLPTPKKTKELSIELTPPGSINQPRRMTGTGSLPVELSP
jgi:aldehyde:ferredoxin oxidoreductase